MVIALLTYVPRKLVGLALDLAFGPEEYYDPSVRTTPIDSDYCAKCSRLRSNHLHHHPYPAGHKFIPRGHDC